MRIAGGALARSESHVLAQIPEAKLALACRIGISEPMCWGRSSRADSRLASGRRGVVRGPKRTRLLSWKSLGGILSSTIVAPAASEPVADRRRRALWVVVFCTLIGAAAQILIKTGANHLRRPGFLGAITAMFTNPPVFFGYCLLGVFTALLIYALRDGELSMLYPVIALTYVWVSILSVVIFHESMNALKMVGVLVIVIGVAVLGRGGGKV